MAPKRAKPKAPRRAPGSGTIIERADGRLEVRFAIPDELGNRVPYSAYFPRGTARAVAEAYLAQINAAKQLGLATAYEAESVATFLRRWLAEQDARTDLKPSTKQTYHWAVERHLLPALQHIEIRELRKRHIKVLKARLVATLSDGTAGLVLRVLRSALSEAERDELVEQNVARRMNFPSSRTSPPVRALTVDEARRLLAQLRPHPYYLFFLLAIYRGMRQGEIRALRWPLVDLAQGRLEVRHTLFYQNASRYELTTPKTPRSVRTLPLNTELVEAFAARKVQQDYERREAGDAWADRHALVLTTPEGHPLSYSTLRWLYQRVCAELDIPHPTLHGLRHTANTLMAGEGIDITTRRAILGHETDEMNLHYDHASDARVRQALETYERKVREG